MRIIGLTGGIGSGKSEATRIFESLGVPVIDVDMIAHQLTAKGQKTLACIVEQFGPEFLLEDGHLCRQAMRKRVFSDADARHQLESILHPAIFDQAQSQLKQIKDAPYVVLAVPLLFESPRYLSLIDQSLLIDCEESVQISRTMHRSGLNQQEVKAIMHAQMPRAQRLALADIVIDNNGNKQDLRKKIEQFHQNSI